MIDMFLFVVIHERVGFCLGMGAGFFIAGILAWIIHLVGQ